MSKPNYALRVALASALTILIPSGDALAGRGGGGGGGRPMGGGGGGRPMGGGGMARPAVSHTPSFSSPRPNQAAAGNFARPNFNAAARPNFNAAAAARPNFNAAAAARPNVNNINRPTTNNFNNLSNRTNINTANINNRTANINNTNINNRTANINNTNTNINNRTANINNINRTTNVTNVTNINNVNRNNNWGGGGGFNNWGGGRGGFNGYNGWGARAPYYGYHNNWVNGSWNYHNSNYNWGYFGAGFATGLATWGLYSSLSNWGYNNYRYSNPYYYAQPTVIVQQQPLVVQSPYNYAQPINTQAALPAPTVTEAAMATFDDARAAFKVGDYPTALQRADAALAQIPNDPTLHEFRALTLFAQKQYDPAAASLFAVLSIGPGWDWTTMVGLYPNVDVYTGQLRALEDFSRANPNLPSAHFVLAYHYLTQGFPDNAASELKQVLRVQPNDALSARMLSQLTAKPDPASANAAASDIPPALPTAVAVGPVPPGGLAGKWVASPAAGTTITLTVDDAGAFSWQVADKSGPRTLTGTSTFANGVLTLASDKGDPLVGRIAFADPASFSFKAAGGGNDDPGLSFKKTN